MCTHDTRKLYAPNCIQMHTLVFVVLRVSALCITIIWDAKCFDSHSTVLTAHKGPLSLIFGKYNSDFSVSVV